MADRVKLGPMIGVEVSGVEVSGVEGTELVQPSAAQVGRLRRLARGREGKLGGMRVVHSFAAAEHRANPEASESRARVVDAGAIQGGTRSCGPIANGRRSPLLGTTADEVVGLPRDEGRAFARSSARMGGGRPARRVARTLVDATPSSRYFGDGAKVTPSSIRVVVRIVDPDLVVRFGLNDRIAFVRLY